MNISKDAPGENGANAAHSPQTATNNLPRTVDAWVNRLNAQEIPILAETAANIPKRIANQDAMTMVAEEILSDPFMTAKLLRLTHNAIHRTHTPFSFSRSMVMLGLTEVLQVCRQAPRVGLKSASFRHELKLAQSTGKIVYQCARLARLQDMDEIVAAGLLHRIGPLLFWATSNHAAPLQQRIEQGGAQSEAEYDMLGIRLAQLSAPLLASWGISGAIKEALEWTRHANTRVILVQQAHSLAKKLVIDDSPDEQAIDKGIATLAATLRLPGKTLTEVIKEMRNELA